VHPGLGLAAGRQEEDRHPQPVGGEPPLHLEAVEKHGTLIHAGDCEHEWGSSLDADDDEEGAA
jgi:hypothetical protein